MQLETARLLLRPVAAADLESLVALDNDPEVMFFINAGAPTPRAEVEADLHWWLGYPDRYPAYGFYAAIEKATGDFLGWFHLRPGEGAGPDEPELGYRLVRRVWGRGLATEGSRALVDAAFAQLGATRVNAETMAVNIASRRVMEKAGLRFVRTFDAGWPVRIPGDEQGDVEYAISRAEWEADQRAGRAAT